MHENIPNLLDEFTYRWRYELSNGDIYHRFLDDISKFQKTLLQETVTLVAIYKCFQLLDY